MDVIGYLSITTILINCVFIYWFRNDFVAIARDNIRFMNFIYPDPVMNSDGTPIINSPFG